MEVFIELGLILLLATGVSVVMKLLKQPLIIGYILTGILAGPYSLNILKSVEEVDLFSKLGITILLFIVGLNLSPKVIKEVGKVSLVTGLGQIIFTSLIGFFITYFLGFNIVNSLYIAIALTFSSTIVIMKLLSDRGDSDKLYGRISVGFLLVQDIVAAIILLLVSAFSSGENLNYSLFLFGRGVLVITVLGVISYKILPKICNFFAQSQELLFLFSVSFGIAVSGAFYALNLSFEIGALFAGVLISSTPYAHEISLKMRPLRDFFITLFFVLLGAHLMLGAELLAVLIPSLVLSVFVLIGNPIIVFVLMNLLGYSSSTAFKAGLNVAQISEFSLIIMSLGLAVGQIDIASVSLVTLVGMLTITGSTYLILYSDQVYNFSKPIFKFLEFRKTKGLNKTNKISEYDVILFGYNRIGKGLLKSVQKFTTRYLVIDFDPDKISELTKKEINVEYGDLSDIELLEDLSIERVKMVISTVNDLGVNLALVSRCRSGEGEGPIVIAVSDSHKDTHALYDAGASYVIMPHYLGSLYSSGLILKNKLNNRLYKKSQDMHKKRLSNFYGF